MNLIYKSDFPKWGFSNYFVGYCDKLKIPEDQTERRKFCFAVPGCLELTWNHGTEKKDERVYNTGNADTVGSQDGKKVQGGFGHVGIIRRQQVYYRSHPLFKQVPKKLDQDSYPL